MASADEYAAWIVENKDRQGTPEFEKVAAAYNLAKGEVNATASASSTEMPPATGAERLAGSFGGRALLGAGTLLSGPLQLGANVGDKIAEQFGFEPVVGKAINEHLAKLEGMKQRGTAAEGSEGFDWAGLIGSGVIGGAALKNVPVAATYLGKIAQGAGIGAGFGAATPVTSGGESFGSEKAMQIGGGAAVGGALSAALPAVQKAGSALYNVAEPMFNTAAIKGRAFLDAAGDKADEIIALLRANKQIVPGSLPTAGEAAVPAGSAEFAAFQRSAANARPSDYLARSDAQNAARLGAVRTVGQDEAALRAAELARKTAADPLYAAARAPGNIAQTSPVMAQVEDLLSRNPGNRELVNELTNIRRGLVDEKGRLRVDAEEVASVVDGLKAAIKNEDNKFIGGALRTLQTNLEKAIPGYERAQQVFREKSAPVNQMQVGQYLEKKLVPALSEDAKQKAATYASALQDAPGTIKRATGAPRFETLTEALTPDQLSVVNSVRDDLARGARFEAMASKGGKAAPNAIDLASASMESAAGGKIPNLLHRGAMITNAIITRMEGSINKKLAAEIAVEMLNPPGVAKSMVESQFRAQRNAAIAAAIERYKLPFEAAAAQTSAREYQP